MIRTLCILLCLLLFTACEQQPETPNQTPVKAAPVENTTKTPAKSALLMRDPVVPKRFELPSEALQIWRQFKNQKPALVIFSENPFLVPIPELLGDQIRTLIKSGSAEDFKRSASIQRVAPLLPPQQALSAAIDSQLISEIVWYFPSRADVADFNADDFAKLMGNAGFISEENASLFKNEDQGMISGQVRGIPLRILHPMAALPELNSPALIHIDLGYFRGLFKNSVSTPLYSLMQETAQLMRDAQWPTLAVTTSYSNEGGLYSLETRFLITDITQLIEQPSLLDGDMPKSWKTRKEALFSEDFYQESKARDLIMQSAEENPDDASVQYDAYRVLIENGQNDAAFPLLDKIVTMDPGYADEYLTLVETGLEKGWDNQTLTLLDKAAQAMPYNPFIPLRKVDLLLKMGQLEEAQKINDEYAKRPWSKVYHPEVADYLKRPLELPKEPETTPPLKESEK